MKLFSAILCIFCYNLFQSTLDLSFRGINHSNVYIFPKALLCTFSAKSWKMAYFLVFKHILYNNDALPGNFSLYTFQCFKSRNFLLDVVIFSNTQISWYLYTNFKYTNSMYIHNFQYTHTHIYTHKYTQISNTQISWMENEFP